MALLVRVHVNTDFGHALVKSTFQDENLDKITPDQIFLVSYQQVIHLLGRVSYSKLMSAKGGTKLDDPLRLQIIKKVPDAFLGTVSIRDLRPPKTQQQAVVEHKTAMKMAFVSAQGAPVHTLT